MGEFSTFLTGLAYVVLAVVVLAVSKIVKDLLTPYKVDEELTARDNPALGFTLTGYFAGVLIIYLGAVIGEDVDYEAMGFAGLASMIGIDFCYALGGMIALNLGRWIVDKLVLYKFSTVKEIIQDRNVGTAAVEAGSFVATALVVAGAIQGEGSILSAVVFFALGQIVLILFAQFYQWITKYDIHAEIEKDNVAAGVALGTSLVAVGILLLGGVGGDFIGWAENLMQFAYYVVFGFVLLFVLRKVLDFVLLPGTTIAHEIAKDRNINAAWIEGVVSMGMATVILFMI